MTAYERIVAALPDARDTGTSASARCPAHDDTRPSLSVRHIEGSALVHCHAGCETPDVLAALGLSMADLYDHPRGETYQYPDGRRVHRSPDKRFRQTGNTGGDNLFHADRIGDAPLVHVVEGEKDVLAVETVGGTAVCSAMGAGKAHRADWSPLHGRDVVIVADRDEPGYKHSQQVAEILRGKARSVQVVQSPHGKDAADGIAAGYALHDFTPIDPVEQTTGLQTAAADRPRLWAATELHGSSQVRWLAQNRLQRGAINLLIGDEGIGKSLLWVYVVTAVTTGKPLPEFGIPVRDPGHVLLILTEDDWSSTVRPRLEVAGADLARITVVCTDADGGGAPIFPRDMDVVRAADPTPVLIVVDAWLDTVHGSLSVRDPQQARQALHPWREQATVTDAAVLLLCHTNRVASGNPRDRYGATGELRKKARMTLYAQSDDEGHLIVGPEKANAAAPISASVFTIHSVQHFAATSEGDGTVPLLTYVGDSERTAREHVAASVDDQDEAGGNPAKAFVLDHLMDNGGERLAGEVLKAGRAAGFSDQELKDARRRLRSPRVVSRKASFGDGWVWAIDVGGTSDRQGGAHESQGGEDGSPKDMPSSAPPSPPSPPSAHPVPPSRGGSDGAPRTEPSPQGGIATEGGVPRDTPPSATLPVRACSSCGRQLRYQSHRARGYCSLSACIAANREAE